MSLSVEMSQRLSSDTNKIKDRVEVIVFELENVICTHAASKLKDKIARSI